MKICAQTVFLSIRKSRGAIHLLFAEMLTRRDELKRILWLDEQWGVGNGYSIGPEEINLI